MRRFRFLIGLSAALAIAGSSGAENIDLVVDGSPWAQTVVTPYDDSRAKHRIVTYKVYTHLYDFDGKGFLTKGEGGLYTHHRGLFIGWMKTGLGDTTVDSWHMRGCYQEHVGWLATSGGSGGVERSQMIEWRTKDHETFIRERRSIAASPHASGARVFDFRTQLTAVDQPVVLEGDAQHAGMQIRLANEVSEHPETTNYILPATAEIGENDTITGANWACAEVDIRGVKYWVVHMTPADHPTGTPVYSTRDYGRFGAFFETTVEPGAPLKLAFRIILSRESLDQAACDALYAEYNAR